MKKDVLYIDPHQVRLQGQDYGFFPGCCGIFDRALVVCGSTAFLQEKAALDAFLLRYGFSLLELYAGDLMDLGSIFFV